MTAFDTQMAGIRERLAKARVNAGLSQSQVATMMKMDSAATISHYESGARGLSMETFLKLCAIYGVSQEWVLTGVNPNFNREDVALMLAQTKVSMEEAIDLLDLLESQEQKPPEDKPLNIGVSYW